VQRLTVEMKPSGTARGTAQQMIILAMNMHMIYHPHEYSGIVMTAMNVVIAMKLNPLPADRKTTEISEVPAGIRNESCYTWE